MPGILPMKVIKVGSNAQSRIAQACDRCRSKKIRCDGIRPCCSQCANVGFECKTSDKLSRRAFPRGYTESLEERVRGLEAEVRELKELLDEKDEKIDMLSRIHSHSLQSIQLPSPRRPSSISLESIRESSKEPKEARDEVFRVQQSPCLLDEDGSDSYFCGTSSTRTLLEAYKERVNETGQSDTDLDIGLLLANGPRRQADLPNTPPYSPVTWKTPPRLISDQLVNIFFQEWAPLFPVLHRPNFLTLYEKYVADGDSVTDKAELAQLNLVFGIASLSNGVRTSANLESFESQWRAALDAIITDTSMSTLQCLVLAQLYCIQSADSTRLISYKGLSTTLSARLGLHQSQKRFALDTLTCEIRKKVFWTLYVLDSFTAITLGLPKHIKDEDVCCEYPVDADDEYITESGFQPTLPGESTKVSSALALFRLARILSRVLEEVFPAKSSYDLSLRRLSELSADLDSWNTTLAPHLHLQFTRDKPSTATTNSRSPLLSLAYHYIRTLLQRPVLCATLGPKESTYMMAMASSCKHMIQILQLLDERGLCFSFCLNRDELLVLCGVGFLFQDLSLDKNSKMLKDNAKLTHVVSDMLTRSGAPSAAEFERISTAPNSANPKTPQLSRQNSAASDPVIVAETSTRKQLKAIASRFAANNSFKIKAETSTGDGRSARNGISLHPQGSPSSSVPSLQPPTYSPVSVTRSEPARSPTNTTNALPVLSPGPRHASSLPPIKSKHRSDSDKLPNLDFLSFGVEDEISPARTKPSPAAPVKSEGCPTDWEKLLGNLENGETNIYDACYLGAPVHAPMDAPRMGHSTAAAAVAAAAAAAAAAGAGAGAGTAPSSDITETAAAWDGELWALCQTDTETGYTPGGRGGSWADAAGSIFSFTTDDCGSSGEDLVTDWASAASSATGRDSHPSLMPVLHDEVDLEFDDGWDPSLSL